MATPGVATYSFNAQDRTGSATGSLVANTGTVSNIATADFRALSGGNYLQRLVANSLSLAASIADAKYLSITLTGDGVVTRIRHGATKGGTGDRGFGLRSSNDAFASNIDNVSNIPTTQPAITAYDYTVSQPFSGTWELRIYPYTASGTGSVEFDYIIIDVEAGSSAVTVSPSGGSLLLVGHAPTITQAAALTVSPATGSVILAGYVPTITQAAGIVVAPSAGTVLVSGHAPSLVQTAGVTVRPEAGSAIWSGYSPLIAQEAAVLVSPVAGAVVWRGRRPIVGAGGAAGSNVHLLNTSIRLGIHNSL